MGFQPGGKIGKYSIRPCTIAAKIKKIIFRERMSFKIDPQRPKIK
jgi:hypothetical protein